MKISKLFHWLYAILMFLPILVFIPNAFYYGFNKEAVAQEKTEYIPNYYESNEVNSVNDLVVGNVYRLIINPTLYFNPAEYILCEDILSNTYTIDIVTGDVIYDTPYISKGLSLRITYGDSIQQLTGNGYIDFLFASYVGEGTIIPYLSKCPTKYLIDYESFKTNMSITDSMSYAWYSVWHNDMFSWTYDSFLTQPFLYITNLFNVPATNTLVYCLSYWLNISIIWLTFDLVMYVPLLVHRWLDKGVIE